MKMVSVIIPVYNVERYLEPCLDSVFHQTCQDMEVICVNDCSEDSSGAEGNKCRIPGREINVGYPAESASRISRKSA